MRLDLDLGEVDVPSDQGLYRSREPELRLQGAEYQRALDPHERNNELPIGPNKLLFGNTCGIVARLIERWQTSFIFNGSSGTPTSFNPGISHFYAPSGYDIVSPNWVIPKAHVEWNEGTTTGTMYPGNKYLAIPIPSVWILRLLVKRIRRIGPTSRVHHLRLVRS